MKNHMTVLTPFIELMLIYSPYKYYEAHMKVKVRSLPANLMLMWLMVIFMTNVVYNHLSHTALKWQVCQYHVARGYNSNQPCFMSMCRNS